MKEICEYIRCLEPSQVPLSAAVYLIQGEQNTYVFDVGRSEDSAAVLASIPNKVLILSHYHGDHSDNLSKLEYRQLYVAENCARMLGVGHSVSDQLKLYDGVELWIRSCPSVHVEGCLILLVNKEYCLLGDVYLHRATFDSEKAWQMLAVLKRMPCRYFLLSHGENLLVPKEELIAELEKEFQ